MLVDETVGTGKRRACMHVSPVALCSFTIVLFQEGIVSKGERPPRKMQPGMWWKSVGEGGTYLECVTRRTDGMSLSELRQRFNLSNHVGSRFSFRCWLQRVQRPMHCGLEVDFDS